MRYINGLQDHWTDLINKILNLNTETRFTITNLGSEHPKINKIIDLNLLGISLFFKAFQTLNNAFHRHKERDDNRWSNIPVLL